MSSGRYRVRASHSSGKNKKAPATIFHEKSHPIPRNPTHGSGDCFPKDNSEHGSTQNSRNKTYTEIRYFSPRTLGTATAVGQQNIGNKNNQPWLVHALTLRPDIRRYHDGAPVGNPLCVAVTYEKSVSEVIQPHRNDAAQVFCTVR